MKRKKPRRIMMRVYVKSHAKKINGKRRWINGYYKKKKAAYPVSRTVMKVKKI